MQNLVMLNAPNKRSAVQQFIRNRGVREFKVITDSQVLFQYLMVETCNLFIFDFFLDMSLINIISDMKESVNVLQVYVPDSRTGKPYLTLTDNVSVMPDEVDFLSWFWDHNVCSLKNVLECEATGKPYYRFELPAKPMDAKKLKVIIRPNRISAKYMNSAGKVVRKSVNQLTTTVKISGTPSKNYVSTRKQIGIFDNQERVVDIPRPIPEKVDVEVQDQEPLVIEEEELHVPKKGTGFFGFFRKEKKPKVTKEKKLHLPAPKPKEKNQRVETEEEQKFIHVGEVAKSGKTIQVKGRFEKEPILTEEIIIEEPVIEETLVTPDIPDYAPNVEPVQEETNTPEPVKEPTPEPEKVEEPIKIPQVQKRKKVEINLDEVKNTERAPVRNKPAGLNLNKLKLSTAATIEDYMAQNGYITQEERVILEQKVREAKSLGKPVRFGNLAAREGYITLEELVTITSEVFRMEIIPWSQLEKMPVNLEDFTLDRCKELTFFRTADDANGNVQIIVSSSTSTLDSAIRRLYDKPRMRYTLAEYIQKRLEM